MDIISGDVVVPSARVELHIEPHHRHRRWTVLLRLVLAIPHLIAMIAIGIAVLLVTLYGWVGALVLGHLPRGAERFLLRVLRYMTRVGGYLWLLTDRFPKVSFDEDDFPVRAEIQPSDLNRLAVFFRILLCIPAYLVSGAIGVGQWLLGIPAWLAALVTGRVPRGLYDALATMTRYQTRFYAYVLLLTGEYPWGWLGDRGGPPPAPVFGAPVTPAVRQPMSFSLRGGTKVLIVVSVVLGFTFQAANALVSLSGVADVVAVTQMAQAYQRMDTELQGHLASSQDCASLRCVRSIHKDMARSVRAFSVELKAIAFPERARADLRAVRRSAGRFADALVALSKTRTIAGYERVLQRNDLEALGVRFDDAVRTLAEALT